MVRGLARAFTFIATAFLVVAMGESDAKSATFFVMAFLVVIVACAGIGWKDE